jgi:hypothetical protein
MRKKILVLLLAVAFAAASLMPATASANIKFPLCHNGQIIEVDLSATSAHSAHGDTLICP